MLYFRRSRLLFSSSNEMQNPKFVFKIHQWNVSNESSLTTCGWRCSNKPTYTYTQKHAYTHTLWLSVLQSEYAFLATHPRWGEFYTDTNIKTDAYTRVRKWNKSRRDKRDNGGRNNLNASHSTPRSSKWKQTKACVRKAKKAAREALMQDEQDWWLWYDLEVICLDEVKISHSSSIFVISSLVIIAYLSLVDCNGQKTIVTPYQSLCVDIYSRKHKQIFF